MNKLPNPYVSTKKALSRRRFLKGAGVALSLPLLDAMKPAFASAGRTASSSPEAPPRRMFAICNNLGMLPQHFFPKDAGPNYTLSPYLEGLKKHRNDFTVFSGVWNPDVDGGHPADICFLTAKPHPARGGFRNTISLDQFMAERIGHLTRVPSLNLGVNVIQGYRSLSWTANGVLIPCEESPANIFRRFFVQGNAAGKTAQIRRLELGRSILDAVGDQAKALQRNLGARDRNRLEQYFTSVRDLEQRMIMTRQWTNKPKPVVDVPEPTDPTNRREYMEKVGLMYDMAKLAFETDSTRVIALLLDSVNSPAIHLEGTEITDGYHNLSHHGKSETKLAQLKVIDEHHITLLDKLLSELKDVEEDGEPLLDRTMILYGSNLGDADKHVTTNLPVIFAGGGFQHGQHLAFDTQINYPLPNLFVSMLQRMGIEVDKFASSTGTMRGLEFA